MDKIMTFIQLVVMTYALSDKDKLLGRVYKGVPDAQNKYPYVVLIRTRRISYCTGSALNSKWVLTVAHCIYKGKMYIAYKKSKRILIVRVLKTYVHPRYDHTLSNEYHWHFPANDIALLYTKKIGLRIFGKLIAVDYRSLWGLAAEYGGHGRTTDDSQEIEESQDSQERARSRVNEPLQLGYGVITSCEGKKLTSAYLCVVSKCSNRKQATLPGDSGGPVFVEGMIAGVLYGGSTYPHLSFFTAVSPNLNWIYSNIEKRRRKKSKKKKSKP